VLLFAPADAGATIYRITYHDRYCNPNEPELEDDEEILSHVSDDPTNPPKRKNDPVKEQFGKSLALVVHRIYYYELVLVDG
jgi:hypothetical protein